MKIDKTDLDKSEKESEKEDSFEHLFRKIARQLHSARRGHFPPSLKNRVTYKRDVDK